MTSGLMTPGLMTPLEKHVIYFRNSPKNILKSIFFLLALETSALNPSLWLKTYNLALPFRNLEILQKLF